MGQASDQCVFEFAFAVFGVEVEEVEVVRVLENAVGQVGFVRGECAGEVVRCISDSQVSSVADVVSQGGSRPAVLGGLFGVPSAHCGVGEPIE